MAIDKLKCPKCGTAEVDSLASGDLVLRYQCKKLECLNQWNVPRVGYNPDPPAEETSGDVEEKLMANERECRKGCGRSKFNTPKSKGQHERYCTGKAAEESKPRRKPARAADAPAQRRKATAPAITAFDEISRCIADLRASRSKLVDAMIAENPEILAIDNAIAALEVRPT